MIKILDDGRCFLNYGPIQMTIDIEVNSQKREELEKNIAKKVIEEFERMLPFIEKIKKNKIVSRTNTNYPVVLKKLTKAVDTIEDKSYTLLAAIAGSFSEYALEEALEIGGERVIINNGGDIALKDIYGKDIKVGIPLNNNSKEHLQLTIRGDDGIEGICTSGFGGRSFTKGIASTAVALASKASIADICATYIGNETNVNDKSILRANAEEIDSGTDLKGHQITVKVGNITKKKKLEALLRGYNSAEKLYNEKIIKGSVIVVDNEIIMIPQNIAKIKNKER
jgi:ApbE superfamily uncharacterized protein (UPF0280 family)